ncbi:MAG TPA: hypothetical protein VJH69_00625 [Candidatus Paceibacterota bacterium]
MISYLFLILAFSLNAAANILLKIAATSGFSFSSLFAMQWNRAHLIALGAVILFAGNLAAYLLALEKIPLTVGYPVMIGMTFVLTVGFASYFGERLSLIQLAGLLLILVGIFMVVRLNA